MTPPVVDYNSGSDNTIFTQYSLINSLKDKFIIKNIDVDDVDSFLYAHNDINNIFMKMLVYIADNIKEINPKISLSLKVIQDGYDDLLEISVKTTDFDDTYKIEELDDSLDDIFSFDFLDKIIIFMEF